MSTSQSPLFQGVVYYINETVPQEQKAINEFWLKKEGAKEALSPDDITHFITDTIDFPLWESLKGREDQGIFVCTPQWVTRCAAVGKQSAKFYSPHPKMFFSGVCVCCDENSISLGDIEAITGAVDAYGGQNRVPLTKEVTHLICASTSSKKYEIVQANPDLKILSVSPHWFDRCLALKSCISAEMWTFPNGAGFDENLWARADKPFEKAITTVLVPKKGQPPAEPFTGKELNKGEMLKSLMMEDKPAGDFPVRSNYSQFENIFDGKMVLLGKDLSLDASRRRALKQSVIEAGGLWVENSETMSSSDVNILVTKYRSGYQYRQAVRQHLIIGTLAWFYQVLKLGKLFSSKDHLLHYPIPKDPIPGFKDKMITISNYTGDSRDYLRKLIAAMGGQFTAAFSRENTHIIAASKFGEKVSRGVAWKTPIVNHKYLERCFIEWKDQPLLASSEWSQFPPDVNWMLFIGHQGLTQEDLEPWHRFPAEEDPQPAVEIQELRPTPVVQENQQTRPKPDADIEMNNALAPTATATDTVDDRIEVDENLRLLGGMSTAVLDREPEEINHREAVAYVVVDALDAVGVEADEELAVMEVDNDTSIEELTRPPPSGEAHEPIAVDDKSEPGDLAPDQLLSPLSVSPAPVPKGVQKMSKSTSVQPEDEMNHSGGSATATPRNHHRAPTLRSPSKGGVDTSLILQGTHRRAAAIRAEQDLHDKIMPDLNSFEKDKRNGTIMSGGRRGHDDWVEGLRSSPSRAVSSPSTKPTLIKYERRPTSTSAATNGKGKKRANHADQSSSSSSSDEDEEDSSLTENESDDEIAPLKSSKRPPPPPPPKATAVASKRGMKRTSELVIEDQVEDAKRKEKKSKASAASSRIVSVVSNASATEISKVKSKVTRPKILMTQCRKMEEDMKNTLIALGAKFIESADGCTHLVAGGISRTEKFLTAVPQCQFIVSQDWLTDSAKAKTFLDETKYHLQDRIKEKEYHFKLLDSIKRASRPGGKKVFDGFTFYSSPKVETEFSVLERVVVANGGALQKLPPAPRTIQGKETTRFVVGCKADKDLLKPFVDKNIKVYTRELILTAALTQQIDFKDNFVSF